ncbi:MAG: DUF1998 domain-containing protein [Kofleriaceae bacterium]|jgi:hypothetical protein|nr:DUF1998 domain-containing protein [Kofleriaceae bacterium]MBP9171799.1 DUF1998 domain-containing protein [Kofleriaceae bacterium]MBP9861334.1 DUF1998 domain-containing protein [Kofleriaceae bacterium]
MKRRRFKKGKEQPPVGEARRSQLLTTYGAGSMIDLVDRSILVGGLDYWNYDGKRPVIHEPRLAARLLVQFKQAGRTLNPVEPFSPPPECDDQTPNEKAGIQVLEFPRWLVCQACRQLVQASNSLPQSEGRYRHPCGGKNPLLVPVRFVVMCGNGHLEEFPWSQFVHEEAGGCTGTTLTLTEDAGAELLDVRVTCVTCETSRTMDKAEPFVRGSKCHGYRPWLGRLPSEDCNATPTMKVRTSSSTYFGIAASALSIPNAAERLEKLVRKHLAMLMDVEHGDLAGFIRLAAPLRVDLGTFPTEQVWTVLDAVRRGETIPSPPVREAEYTYVQGVPIERPGDTPTEDERAASFFARRLAPAHRLPTGIERVVLVRQLREVHAQVGFSRLAPIDSELDGDVQVDRAHLGHLTDWLPAVENRGEGLWIQLDEDLLARWEQRAVVQRRATALRTGWHREFGSRTGPAFFGPRYYLLHSLSHLLIQAIALDCGYGASSLRERIYCSRPGASQTMAAILLVTTTPGSEGTLGGLVAQGRRVDVHLERALALARLCSNDPVCAGHAPDDDHGERHLEGAACHGCLYLAEVSCERMNRMLDRALVVPVIDQPPELAFFGDGA